VRDLTRSSLLFAVLILLFAATAAADTTSYTGVLANSTDTYTLTFSLATAENVTVQTWGFGGGTNAAGKMIATGGFDPFIGFFSGSGSSASILTDALGNPYGTSDALSNFTSFAGCPPAGTVDIGGAVCGDVTTSLALATGTYTLLLSDGLYIPNAVFDNGTLGEGFSDFTAGTFQTCNTEASGASVCANDTGSWAFDLTTKAVSTSEPGSILLLALGLTVLTVAARRTGAALG
jgi:hypothetical protein